MEKNKASKSQFLRPKITRSNICIANGTVNRLSAEQCLEGSKFWAFKRLSRERCFCMVVDSTLACTSTRRMVSGTIVSFLAVLLFNRGKKVVAHSSRLLQACWHRCLRSRRRLKPIITPELIGSQSRRLAQAIPCYLFSVIIRLAMLFMQEDSCRKLQLLVKKRHLQTAAKRLGAGMACFCQKEQILIPEAHFLPVSIGTHAFTQLLA